MAVEKVERIKGQRFVNLTGLGRLGPEWAEREIRGFAAMVAVEEIQAQIKLGNPPTRIVFDRRQAMELKESHQKALAKLNPANANDYFPEFRSRIQTFYGGLEKLADAVEFAHRRLVTKIPRLTGTAAGLRMVDGKRAIYFWCSDPENRSRSRVCTNTAEVRQWLSESHGNSINVRILGPTIEYRRDIIYRTSRVKQRSRWVGVSRGLSPGYATDRYKFTARYKALTAEKKGRLTDRIGIRSIRPRGRGKTIYQTRVADAINSTVAGEVRRAYRDVWVGYRFTRSKESLPIKDDRWRPSGQNIHIPEIYLGMKRLGPRGR